MNVRKRPRAGRPLLCLLALFCAFAVSAQTTNQVATPTFTPASGASVPTNVTISCATPGAAIYYTLDGTLPTQSSTHYTGAFLLASASTVRAVGITNGWVNSAAGVAYYGPPAAPANAQVTRSVNTSSPTAPVVTLNVTPGVGSSCEAVTEWLPPGLAATGVSAGGNYIASNNVVIWGPFFGTGAQTLSYTVVGVPGFYPVRATWSVDGTGGGEPVEMSILVSLYNNANVSSVARNANGSITLNFEGMPNATTRIWATTNLASPVIWQPIFTNYTTGAGGNWQFTDTHATNFSQRYYRISTP